MKKLKRIFAIIGIIAILFPIVLMVIGAITATPQSPALFMASLYSAVVIPIMLYAYMLVYKLVKKKSKDSSEE